VGHASFETSESGEVAGLLGVILGEGSDTAVVVFGSASRGETEVTVSRGFEFSMRHLDIF